MKIASLFIFTILLFSAHCSSDPNILVNEMICEIQDARDQTEIKKQAVFSKIEAVNWALQNKKLRMRAQVKQLVLKNHYLAQLNEMEMQGYAAISKIRFIKGLQIIRLLYEKILSLDHHFTTVTTFSEMAKMANPHTYPAFNEVSSILANSTDKKNAFDLTEVLGTNTVVSVVNTMSNLFVSSLSRPEKETELQKIECILDFTVRMQHDLNTIFYETAFLTSANQIVKTDIETLFMYYIKPLGYKEDLPHYRGNDDGGRVKILLGDY